MSDEDKRRVKKPIVSKEPSFISDLWQYARDEYIIPKSYEVMHDMMSGLTNMAADAVNGTLDKIFYDNEDSYYISKKTSSKSKSKEKDYSTISTEKAKSSRIETSNSSRKPYGKKIWVKKKDEARDIRDEAYRLIDEFGNVRVGDLYQMVDEDTSSIDWSYGWTNRSDIKIKPYRKDGESGYLFDLPTPEKIDNLD